MRTAASDSPRLILGLGSFVSHSAQMRFQVRSVTEYLSHYASLPKSKLRHTRVHRVSANSVQDEISRRVIADDDHEVHEVTDG